MSNAEMLAKLASAVENLDSKGVKPLVEQALAAGLQPSDILTSGLSEGMRRVGKAFNTGDMFMPEVLVACDVYFGGLEVVRPLLAARGDDHVIGTMVLGNIHGDIHTVGKNVAVPVFEANGIRVFDIGVSASDDAFVEAIRKHKPQVVGFGTYMTSTFMHTKETVAAIEKAGLRDQVKIICGGPAVDADAARRMGADDATDDAWIGVQKIKRLLGVADDDD
jgi:5-methyltetrahydrofolate--homocysteine methyltransferase